MLSTIDIEQMLHVIITCLPKTWRNTNHMIYFKSCNIIQFIKSIKLNNTYSRVIMY